MKLNFGYRWASATEALVTFPSETMARRALQTRSLRSSVLVVDLLSEAGLERRRGLQHGVCNGADILL
ncbi:unnamed protein product [Choristocarpus tenellus]